MSIIYMIKYKYVYTFGNEEYFSKYDIKGRNQKEKTESINYI